jgi:hypothetical protein
VVMVVVSTVLASIEGEGVDEGALSPRLLHHLSTQLTGSLS